jgi:poly(ADP-ribose) glycohydrolase
MEDMNEWVKLPFNESFRWVEENNHTRNFNTNRKSYWKIVEESLRGLSHRVDSFRDLEKAIKKYNFHLRNSNFDVMHQLSDEYKNLIPSIIKLALDLPSKFERRKIPLLLQRQNHTIELSKNEISCLLANAFLCTYTKQMELFPSINFNKLFVSGYGYNNDSSNKLEKLKCILNYFKRFLKEKPEGE